MRKANTQPQSILCPECGASQFGDAGSGPCPACLMKLGMASWQENQSLNQFRLEPTIANTSKLPQNAVPVETLAEKFPQYELLHLVGVGGMGTVYCARQTSLNRLVALKVIKPEANKRAEFADRFIREARAMGQLNHQNIVTVHDFGEIDDLYYFVMEYVDGINLRQMLQGNKLSTRQALEIVPAICDALQYAHDMGIVHRDIKPENILIDTNGVVKIADFGLAKLMDQEAAVTQLTQANHVMGTMHYMAPEQIESPLSVDHRADIYSLGVVIYELLTGELPLGRFAPPSHKVSVDIRLDEIVLQTLAKEPGLRYQRVSEVKSELSSVSSGPAKRRQISEEESLRRFGSSPIPVAERAYPAAANSGKPPVVRQHSNNNPNLPGPIPNCGMLGSLFHPGTWLNAGYLLLSLPLGIIYFVFTVVGLSVGFSTLIVWIGIPILLLAFTGIRSFMFFDRQLTRHLLRTNVPVIRYPETDENKTAINRAKQLAFSGETWKGVVYLLSKLLLGIISFVFCVVLVSIPLSLILSPIAVILFDADMYFLWLDDYPASILASMLGILMAPLCAWSINRLAWMNAEWTKVCLSKQ